MRLDICALSREMGKLPILSGHIGRTALWLPVIIKLTLSSVSLSRCERMWINWPCTWMISTAVYNKLLRILFSTAQTHTTQWAQYHWGSAPFITCSHTLIRPPVPPGTRRENPCSESKSPPLYFVPITYICSLTPSTLPPCGWDIDVPNYCFIHISKIITT